MQEKTVEIPNISCGHCVATIERELSELLGVAGIEDHLKEINYAPAEG